MLEVGKKYRFLYEDIVRRIEANVVVTVSSNKRITAETEKVIEDTKSDLIYNGLTWNLESSELSLDGSDETKVRVFEL